MQRRSGRRLSSAPKFYEILYLYSEIVLAVRKSLSFTRVVNCPAVELTFQDKNPINNFLFYSFRVYENRSRSRCKTTVTAVTFRTLGLTGGRGDLNRYTADTCTATAVRAVGGDYGYAAATAFRSLVIFILWLQHILYLTNIYYLSTGYEITSFRNFLNLISAYPWYSIKLLNISIISD
ncbi:hypothetical protein AGLY_006982 [Aphis glycines]|uniref:Uncharacterized protein n=1 Tax=Aphis glycines TaxID=307491 RepID=A0A6G0TQN3_APHGL|nr:hypothetical protein AGLY_006982 [Aphis glycines]